MHCDTLTESNHILGDILCQDEGDFYRVGSPGISGRTWWEFCKDVLTSAVLNWCPRWPQNTRWGSEIDCAPHLQHSPTPCFKIYSILAKKGKLPYLTQRTFRNRDKNAKKSPWLYVTCFRVANVMTYGQKLAVLQKFSVSRHANSVNAKLVPITFTLNPWTDTLCCVHCSSFVACLAQPQLAVGYKTGYFTEDCDGACVRAPGYKIH